jgi:hypothetical protein
VICADDPHQSRNNIAQCHGDIVISLQPKAS